MRLQVRVAVILLYCLTAGFSKPITHSWQWKKTAQKAFLENFETYLQLYEDEANKLCHMWSSDKVTTLVHNFPSKSPLADECRRFEVCNNNHCIFLGRESWLLSMYSDDVDQFQGNRENVTPLHMSGFIGRNQAGYNEGFDVLSRINSIYPPSAEKYNIYSMIPMNSSIFVHGLKLLNDSINTDCSQQPYGMLEAKITYNTSLSFGCKNLAFCNSTLCIIYPPHSIELGNIFSKNQSQYLTRLMPYCSSIHAGSRFRRDLEMENSKSGLRFNIPGSYRYCGPGTDIAKADDDGGPINDVDEACRQHDLDYMLGVPPDEADERLLKAVYETGSWLYPLFVLAMEAKRYFEKTTGQRYTSYLYTIPPEVAATTTHYFYEKSAYDTVELPDSIKAIGLFKENRWKAQVHQVWSGYCYARGQPAQEDTSKSNPPPNNPSEGESSCQQCEQQPSSDTQNEGLEDSTLRVFPDSMGYPIPPAAFDDCRIVINEIATSNSRNEEQFIELTRVCPEESKKRKRYKQLKGYRLYVIEDGEVPKLHVSASLDNQILRELPEENKGRLYKINYYFVFGKLQNRNDVQLRLNLDNSIAGTLPDGNSGSYAVVLTYDDGSKNLPRKRFPRGSQEPTDLTSEQMLLIQESMQDVLIYGLKCEACDFFATLLQNFVTLSTSMDVPSVRDVEIDNEGNKDYKSLCRCTNSHLPMLQESWEISNPTPGTKNSCPQTVEPPFRLKQGGKLQSSARKMTMNVLHFFEAATKDSSILDATALQLTSRATSLNRHLISDIKKTYETIGVFKTPRGRSQPGRRSLVSKFDSFDTDLIKRIIQGYYQRGMPPFISTVHNDVIKAYENTSDPKTFGIKVFRKLLNKMGFRYGRINQRDCITQRPDIVNKRWTYLETLRENDRTEHLPIVFTDETWIDPNARTGKAIVPKKGAVTYREKPLYSYRKHKVSRGARLIVLHAGGPNGLIHDVMRVYKVGGSKVAFDYHSNVDHQTYMSFMTKLFESLQEAGPHIIVIDNAPYHSKSNAPKQSSRKAEMEEWLQETDPDGSLSGRVPGNKYLKPHLWNMVQRVKNKVEHHIIDIKAKEFGHKIVRLPPYQCEFNPIEKVWSDVKEYIRKNNCEQTIESVQRLAEQYFLTYTAGQFQKHISHTERLRREAWDNDKFYDRFLENHERIIVQVNDDTDDEDTEEDNFENNVLDETDANTDIVYSMVHNEGVIEIQHTDGRRLNFTDNS